jgi:hypothetical protein
MSGAVGLVTGILLATVGAAVVFGTTRTSFVHDVSLAGLAMASVVAGYVASRKNGKVSDPESLATTIAAMGTGIVAGIAFLLVLGAVAIVVSAIWFARFSHFVW